MTNGRISNPSGRNSRRSSPLTIGTVAVAAVLCICVTILHSRTWSSSHEVQPVTSPQPSSELRVSRHGHLVLRHQLHQPVPSRSPVKPHEPHWRGWKSKLYKTADDDWTATGACVAWRQTGECDPDGPLEPHYGRSCSQSVGSGSGYCLCIHNVRLAKSGCGSKSFRCQDVCDAHFAAHHSSNHDATVPAREGYHVASDGEQAQHVVAAARAWIESQLLEQREKDTSKRRALLASADEANAAYQQWISNRSNLRNETTDGSGCVAWRHLRGCDNPSDISQRMPDLDRGCGAVIGDGVRGFCECGSSNRDFPIVVVGCKHRAFTCNHICSATTVGMLRNLIQGAVIDESTVQKRRRSHTPTRLESDDVRQRRDFSHRHLTAIRELRNRNAQKQRVAIETIEASSVHLRVPPDALRHDNTRFYAELDEMVKVTAAKKKAAAGENRRLEDHAILPFDGDSRVAHREG